MISNLLPPPGRPVEISELTVRKAAELADALRLQSIDFAEFVESRVTEAGEVVVFDVEVELPQVRKYTIARRERIAAIFSSEDLIPPEIIALRADFPRVPHLNLRPKELPRSLCLYHEPYRDIKRRWTAARFVARVRDWLALTAKGLLHQDDQPLEPILMDLDGVLLLPSDPFSVNSSDKSYEIIRLPQTTDLKDPAEIYVMSLVSSPVEHGAIHHRPETFAELAYMLEGSDINLLRDVRAKLRFNMLQFGEDQKQKEKFLSATLVVLVLFQQTRTAGGRVEAVDTRAFQTRIDGEDDNPIPVSIRVFGEAIGVWGQVDNKTGLFLKPDTSKRAENILLEILNPIRFMDANMLGILSNRSPQPEQPEFCAIGVGALGSQVVMNLARAGFGRWTLIDDDLLMPHNLARHLLPGEASIGKYKSVGTSSFANSLTDGADLFKAIPANIFFPGDQHAAILSSFSTADVILDMSASVSVARHLSFGEDSSARRLSVFMTPSGADLVLLAEDDLRTIQLDALEMQYYRACLHNMSLEGHLDYSPSRFRYGQSCRDLSSRLPQHLVALHAALASKAIMDVHKQPAAQIVIWRSQEDGTVTRVETTPTETIRMQADDWTVIIDKELLIRLHDLRQRKIPLETGGVLLGSFDLERSVIYIVDTIPSPPDSDEWPTLYIRGKRGLGPQVAEVTKKTDGMLEYIGEWHSHPLGIGTIPSSDDLTVFSWIAEWMGRDGLPALMMIVGDIGRVSCFVAKIEPRENLLPNTGSQ